MIIEDVKEIKATLAEQLGNGDHVGKIMDFILTYYSIDNVCYIIHYSS